MNTFQLMAAAAAAVVTVVNGDIGCTSTLKGYPSTLLWGRQLPTAECHVRDTMVFGLEIPNMEATVYSLDVCNETDYFAKARIKVEGEGSATVTIPKGQDIVFPGIGLGRYHFAIDVTSEPTDDGFSLSINMKACAGSDGGKCITFLTETVPFVVETDGSSPLCGAMNHTFLMVPVTYWIGAFNVVLWTCVFCCICKRRRRRRQASSSYTAVHSTIVTTQDGGSSINYGATTTASGVHASVGFQQQQQQQQYQQQQQQAPPPMYTNQPSSNAVQSGARCCQGCGTAVKVGARFCPLCGATQP